MNHNLTRRVFLAKMGALSIGSFITPLYAGINRGHFDVIIIGGGISGLAAGYALKKAGMNSFAILEARSEVGGRILGIPSSTGVMVEGGAQWVGPSQTAITSLLAELGIATFPTYTNGLRVMKAGRHVIYQDGSAISDSNEDFNRIARELDQLALNIPIDKPWNAPGAELLDTFTLADWLSIRGATRLTLQLFDNITYGLLAAPAQEISLLYFLFYIASAGGFQMRLGFEGGAQAQRIEGGAQRLPLALASLMDEHIFRDQAVSRIQDGALNITVNTRYSIWSAKRVIVAMMPRDAARIAFAPVLPELRRQLMQNWPAGHGYKASVVYERPFWRDRGLNGQVTSFGPVHSVYDNSPSSGSPGVLFAFAKRRLMPESPAARKSIIINDLVKAFGTEARQYIDFVETDWANQPWISGCVSPLGPGFLTRYGPAIRTPIGRIHWAGVETADIWNGKMEGAVRAGQRAADEVLDLL